MRNPMPGVATVSKRVLIVDDEPVVTDVLQEFFKSFRHGYIYDVETASNGVDAYRSVLRARPDLVLLDVNMPGMDGLSLLKHLHAIDPELPVIMISAHQDSRAAAEAQMAGIFSYVPKPFDFRQLEHIVALVFSKSR